MSDIVATLAAAYLTQHPCSAPDEFGSFVYDCALCPFLVSSQDEFQNHLNAEHKSNFLPCVSCGKLYSSSKCLVKHIEFVHQNLFVYCCGKTNCNFKTTIYKTFLFHLVQCIQSSFPCYYCKATFSTPESLIIHLEHRPASRQKLRNSAFNYLLCNKNVELTEQGDPASNNALPGLDNKNDKGIDMPKAPLPYANNLPRTSHTDDFIPPKASGTEHMNSTMATSKHIRYPLSRVTSTSNDATKIPMPSNVPMTPLNPPNGKCAGVISPMPNKKAIVLPKNAKFQDLKAFSINQGLMKAKFIVMTSQTKPLQKPDAKKVSVVPPKPQEPKQNSSLKRRAEPLVNRQLNHCPLPYGSFEIRPSRRIEVGQISADVLCNSDIPLPRITQVGSEREILASLSTHQDPVSITKYGADSPKSNPILSHKNLMSIDITKIKKEKIDDDWIVSECKGSSNIVSPELCGRQWDRNQQVLPPASSVPTVSHFQEVNDFTSNKSVALNPLVKVKQEKYDSIFEIGDEVSSSPHVSPKHMHMTVVEAPKKTPVPHADSHVLSEQLICKMPLKSYSRKAPSENAHKSSMPNYSLNAKSMPPLSAVTTMKEPYATECLSRISPVVIKKEIDEEPLYDNILLQPPDDSNFSYRNSKTFDVGKINSSIILNPVESEEMILPSPADVTLMFNKSFNENHCIDAPLHLPEHSTNQSTKNNGSRHYDLFPSSESQSSPGITYSKSSHISNVDGEIYEHNALGGEFINISKCESSAPVLFQSSTSAERLCESKKSWDEISTDCNENEHSFVKPGNHDLSRPSLKKSNGSSNSASPVKVELCEKELYESESMQDEIASASCSKFNKSSSSFKYLSTSNNGVQAKCKHSDSNAAKKSSHGTVECCSDSSSFDEFSAPLVIDEGDSCTTELSAKTLPESSSSMRSIQKHNLQFTVEKDGLLEMNECDGEENTYVEKSSLTVGQILQKFKYGSRKKKFRIRKKWRIIKDAFDRKQSNSSTEIREVDKFDRFISNNQSEVVKFPDKNEPSSIDRTVQHRVTLESDAKCSRKTYSIHQNFPPNTGGKISKQSSATNSSSMGHKIIKFGPHRIPSASVIDNPQNKSFFLVNSNTTMPVMFVDSTKKVNVLLVKVPAKANMSTVQPSLQNCSKSNSGLALPVSTSIAVTSALNPAVYGKAADVPKVNSEPTAVTVNRDSAVSSVAPLMTVEPFVKLVNKLTEDTDSSSNSNHETAPFKNMTQYLTFCRQRKSKEGLQKMAATPDFFKCMYQDCTYTTNSVSEFPDHCADHPSSSVECAYCLKMFPDAESLIKHSVQLHRRRVFQCSLCFYRACSKTHVQFHLQTYHSDATGSVLTGTPIKTELASHPEEPLDLHVGIKPIVCPFDDCLFSSNSITDVSYHVWKHPVSYSETCEELFCSECRGKFNTVLDWVMHLRLHDIHLLHCLYCTYGCNRRPQMLNHLTSRHADNPLMTYARTSEQLLFILECYLNANRNMPFKSIQCCSSPSNCYCYLLPCPEFEGNSKRINNLLENVKIKRMHFKAFECLYCSSKASSIGKMEKHLKMEHPEEMQLKYYHCVSHPISNSDIKEMYDFHDGCISSSGNHLLQCFDSVEIVPEPTKVLNSADILSAPSSEERKDKLEMPKICMQNVLRFKLFVLQVYISSGAFDIIFSRNNPFLHISLPSIKQNSSPNIYIRIIRCFWNWISCCSSKSKVFKCDYCRKQCRHLKDLRYHWKHAHVQGGKKFSYSVYTSFSKPLHSANKFYKHAVRYSQSRVSSADSIESASCSSLQHPLPTKKHCVDEMKSECVKTGSQKRNLSWKRIDSEPSCKIIKTEPTYEDDSVAQTSSIQNDSWLRKSVNKHLGCSQIVPNTSMMVFFSDFPNPVRIPVVYLKHLIKWQPRVSVMDIREQIIRTHRGFYSRRPCKNK